MQYYAGPTSPFHNLRRNLYNEVFTCVFPALGYHRLLSLSILYFVMP